MTNQLFNMKFTAKQLNKMSSKCEKQARDEVSRFSSAPHCLQLLSDRVEPAAGKQGQEGHGEGGHRAREDICRELHPC